jgi:RNA polymerase sigma-70 factor (ECF subfamily)
MPPDPTARFEAERSRLTAFAYRFLGTRSDAEDVVQDAWLRFAAHEGEIETDGPWLTRVVTNLCLDRRTSAQATRETYVGPWLPEPVATGGGLLLGQPVDPEAISLAFLTLLERLTPLERAVYLLAEAFDYDHAEIASVLGREPAAVRQLLHRAREHVQAGRPRFVPDRAAQQRMLETFLDACLRGDLAGLTALLTEQVVARSDGGGKALAALKPIVGADRVARLLLGLSRKADPSGRFEFAELNGRPSVVGFVGEVRAFVLQLELDGERICAVSMVNAPDKLRHL